MLARAYRWFDRVILELGREFRLSYLPPLMVYVAYGVSGLTAIVGTFFVKDYLGLSAAFLAALAFWINVPWALKMPIGHLVDLIWRFKSVLVFIGAGLIAAGRGSGKTALIERLLSYGVNFSRDESGSDPGGFALGREGGHEGMLEFMETQYISAEW